MARYCDSKTSHWNKIDCEVFNLFSTLLLRLSDYKFTHSSPYEPTLKQGIDSSAWSLRSYKILAILLRNFTIQHHIWTLLGPISCLSDPYRVQTVIPYTKIIVGTWWSTSFWSKKPLVLWKMKPKNYMVEQTYHLERYFGHFGAYLIPQWPIQGSKDVSI